MKPLRHHFRDLVEWDQQGLVIKSTSSDQAVKLFDSALTQYVGWYDDDVGLAATLERMVQADPDFLLGRTLALGLELMGTGVTVRRNPALRAELEALKRMAGERRSQIEWREWAHVEAVDRFASGHMAGAVLLWEDILARHPNDMLALKFAHDTYFYLGDKTNLLDSVERCFNRWWAAARNDPLQAYIHGMYAFGLEESKRYAEAESQAMTGLAKLPQDAWATHALAHVHEMQHRTEDGLRALSSTNTDWRDCNYLACHNYWHWALFEMELEHLDQVVAFFENEIGARANQTGALLDIVDACSLLYRLDLIFGPGTYTTKEQWSRLYQTCEPHLHDHILGFNDSHFAMACLGADRPEQAEQMLEDLGAVKHCIKDDWVPVTEQVLQAIIQFGREQFREATDRLLAVRHEIQKKGGSDAQRDVFNQLLIVAAAKARDGELCRALLKERDQARGQDIVVRRISKLLFDDRRGGGDGDE